MMANFREVMKTVFEAEHNNNPEKVLHYNKKESNYTLYGIYPYTKLPSWAIARDIIKGSTSTKQASRIIAKNQIIYNDVLAWYRENFYNPMGLQYVESTHKAAEIMVFIINVGMGRKKKAVKAIQRIVGAKVDGIIGVETLSKLNAFPEEKFSDLWDKYEVSFYENLVERAPLLSWALNGWRRRARLV